MTVTFDEARGDVLPGQEWVLRVPGVVAVVRRQGDDELLAELIALIQDTVAESGPASGCMLALRLTRWLIGTTEAPAFGTVASTSDGIAVLLHGGVNLCELNGDTFAHTRDGVHLSGHTAALTVDRLMPWPDRPIALSIGTATVAGHGSLGGAPTRPVGLVHGLVPGTGVVLHPPGTGSPVIVKKAADSVTTTPGGIADESVAPITELLESRDKESPAERIEAAPSPSVGRHAAHDGPRGLTAVIQQSDAQQPARMPGAPAEADRDPTSQSAGMSHPIPVIVEGIHCSRGHLNDPRVAFCASCGIRMDNRTAVPVHGRRPPLGLLLLDDGVIHVLDDDCLLGRRPDTDEAVVDGRFRSIRLDDDRGSISRVHAEIRLHNWDTVLVDRGSANGTYIAGPTDTDWSRLVPFQPLVLTPGTQVRIGRRQLTYQSARAQL